MQGISPVNPHCCELRCVSVFILPTHLTQMTSQALLPGGPLQYWPSVKSEPIQPGARPADIERTKVQIKEDKPYIRLHLLEPRIFLTTRLCGKAGLAADLC